MQLAAEPRATAEPAQLRGADEAAAHAAQPQGGCPFAARAGAPASATAPLWQQAQALSGVTPEQAGAIDEVEGGLYARIGEAPLRRLSTLFYERVYADRVPLPTGGLLRDAFANTTKADAASNQAAFLIERLGGPPIYTQHKGPFALIGRHAPYALVTRDAAARWLAHMEAAMNGTPELDADAVRRLRWFFRYTAHFIVEGRALVNPNRLIGYGGSKHGGSV